MRSCVPTNHRSRLYRIVIIDRLFVVGLSLILSLDRSFALVNFSIDYDYFATIPNGRFASIQQHQFGRPNGNVQHGVLFELHVAMA